jgi:hypothetical protein
MRDYRLYCLNAAGSIDYADWIEAADDKQAIAKARELKKNAVKCEVWERHRLVATLNADDLAK